MTTEFKNKETEQVVAVRFFNGREVQVDVFVTAEEWAATKVVVDECGHVVWTKEFENCRVHVWTSFDFFKAARVAEKWADDHSDWDEVAWAREHASETRRVAQERVCVSVVK